jgi:hypothetical protein
MLTRNTHSWSLKWTRDKSADPCLADRSRRSFSAKAELLWRRLTGSFTSSHKSDRGSVKVGHLSQVASSTFCRKPTGRLFLSARRVLRNESACGAALFATSATFLAFLDFLRWLRFNCEPSFTPNNSKFSIFSFQFPMDRPHLPAQLLLTGISQFIPPKTPAIPHFPPNSTSGLSRLFILSLCSRFELRLHDSAYSVYRQTKRISKCFLSAPGFVSFAAFCSTFLSRLQVQNCRRTI